MYVLGYDIVFGNNIVECGCLDIGIVIVILSMYPLSLATRDI